MRPTDPRLVRRLAPARRQLAGVAVFQTLSALLVIGQAFTMTGLVVSAVQDLSSSAVVGWAAASAAVLALRGLAGWATDRLTASAASRVGGEVRRQLVARVLAVPSGTSGDAEASGRRAVLVTRGVTALEPYLTRYLPALALATVLPALTVVAIATQDWLSALIVVLTLPLIPVFGALVGLATRDRADAQWRALSSLSGHFLDVVRGLPTLVAFRRAEAQTAVIRRATDGYRRRTMETLRIAFLSSGVLELVATISVALVAVTVGLRLAAGGLDLHTALVVLLLAPEAYWPLRRVGQEFHAAAEGVATVEQVSALLDTPAAATAPAPATAGEAVAAGAHPAAGALTVEGVTVLREGRTVPALSDVSAVLPARGLTALTGPSGCGKSTLLAVLAGLLPPTSGTVRRDGRPLADATALAAWQRDVAWLPQRPGFVPGTLADNLRLGRPEASEADLWAALAQVALEERVRDLPLGLDTPLGEDGSTLSAGERARLSLARVVVADRPWVLLDEPTAHLDALTERVITDTLVGLARERAVVVVAHRPALVEAADHVVALPAPSPVPNPTTATDAHASLAAATAARPRRVLRADEEEAVEAGGRGRLALATVLGALASGCGVALTATAGWLIVQASLMPPVLTLMVAIVGVRTFGIGRPVLRYAERLLSHDVVLRLLAERRVKVWTSLVPLVPGRLGRRRGDLLASVVDDVDAELDHELRVLMPLRGYVIVAVLATVVATVLVPVAGLVVGAYAALAGAAAWYVARTGAARAERRAVALRAALSDEVVAAAALGEELTMWQAVGTAAESVGAVSDRLGAATTTSATWWGAARAAVLLLTGAGVATTALLVAPSVALGSVSGPVCALLVLLPLALSDVALPLADAGALSARTSAARARLEALATMEPAVTEPRAVGPQPRGTDLDLAGVSAGWEGTTAFEGLDLRVPQGGRVAVVGPSGCGKSTLVALMLRFLDPSAGRVRLGGADLDRMVLADVRGRVGLVDDDPHVFASTVAENVRLARPAASDPEVEAALRAARLGPWLDALPQGLDTWVGDGHAAVSGGERARLAIARSLLADQQVLVLDEPTAHLDEATAEELASEVLGPVRGEVSGADVRKGTGPARTIVWVTHGSAGLTRVDEVIDLGPVAALRGDGPDGPGRGDAEELPHVR
ncbi:thiol reductant ABC exporter subunit CydD [Nocardioides sp. GY 10127]|uniref:thiol reductant ABC exporter subunit CydD n=1 Tax=Nocardioides sp. GY 10127 TaxID=2569762 RepID=UPI0010A8A2B8|nr:thiol reductant ABC exporter subunit CydD [Nocardioides sp. GY 10127]TIC81818.1 thiol reductant ABC exporter subunit CydD [Nocardioides sp. GY 10127]